MSKYFLVARNTWDEITTYRFNFVMWRFRNVLQILTAYFIWYAVIPPDQQAFGYSHGQILTYVLGTAFLSAVVMSSRGHEIGEAIINGSLSVLLLKPVSWFYYWMARDIGDKFMNITFSLGEIVILVLLLRPPLVFQENIAYILLTIVAVFIAIILNFIISVSLAFVGFWSNDIWAPRFMFYVLASVFTGSFFPLDIFPKTISTILEFLPFAFLIYFPVKVYLGQLSFFEIGVGFLVGLFWILGGFLILKIIWNKGLRTYEAYGR